MTLLVVGNENALGVLSVAATVVITAHASVTPSIDTVAVEEVAVAGLIDRSCKYCPAKIVPVVDKSDITEEQVEFAQTRKREEIPPEIDTVPVVLRPSIN